MPEFKDLFARSRRDTHNQIVCKQTLNHLAPVGLSGWVFLFEVSGVLLQSPNNGFTLIWLLTDKNAA